MQIRAHGLVTMDVLADPIQQLNQVQLIEQIVLVPEDELVVRRVVVDHLTPALQLGDRLGRIDSRVPVTGEIAGTNLEQLFIAQVPGHRTIVQGIRPD